MKDKQAFIEAMDLKQDHNGHWYVNGNVVGNVVGNVGGDVGGSVWGSVLGGVLGSVGGNVGGDVGGSVWGSVWGDVVDNVGGNVRGDVKRIVEGKIDGREWTFVDEKDGWLTVEFSDGGKEFERFGVRVRAAEVVRLAPTLEENNDE